jgi:uncharacterized repeat protein (TIGR01451 family)
MTNCSVSNNQSSGNGGGVFNSGFMAIDSSSLSGNSATFSGYGGGIYNVGALTITNSTVSGNSAGYEGGGIFNAYGALTTLTITNSTISSNSISTTNYHDGGRGAGFFNDVFTKMTVAKSTVSDNQCLFCQGGNFYNYGVLIVTDVTFSRGAAANAGQLTLTNDTFSVSVIGNFGTLNIKSTILANGAGGNCSISQDSSFISEGYNLSDDNSCSGFLIGPGDLNNTLAGLDPQGLQDNGGPTKTIALKPGSSAIDAVPVGNGGYCTGADGVEVIATDQRSVSRPQGAGCDIGAFELSSYPAVLTITKLRNTMLALGQQGASYTITVTNAVTGGPTSGTVAVSEILPSGLSLVTMAGDGWSCASTTCTRSDVLAAGGSYPPITATVNVAANAVSPLVNTVTVSGGSSASASASDSALITGAPILSINCSHDGDFTLGQQQAVYSLTVGNANSVAAGSTSGTVTVTDTLPSGFGLVSMAGTGWTCSGNTCSRNDSLAPGKGYPQITVVVNVPSNATSPQINVATVSGGGWDTSNASDLTYIDGGPYLSIAKTHTGNFNLGQQGTYTLTVSNDSGAGPTNSPVAVSDFLPNGLSIASIGGTGWFCAGNTCSRSDVLAAGKSYPAITVTVNVAPNATSPQVNTATVSGGGYLRVGTTHPTPITGAVLSIAKFHTGNFTQGQQGATYTVRVSNASGAGPTIGAVSVADTLPDGLTLVSMTGAGWSCSSATCTRNDVLNAGGSYPPITVTVNVSLTAPSSVTNLAVVSGGGSPTSSASDVTNIILLTYTISGSVTVGGVGLSGVSVSMIGTVSTSTVTNPSGSYSFSGLFPGGTYILSAALVGYSFTGPITLSNLSGNQTANFTGVAVTNSCVGMFLSSTSVACSAISQGAFQGNPALSIGVPATYNGAMTLVGNAPNGDAAGMALYNAGAGAGASVSLDFYNTPFNGGIPQAKVKAVDDGNYSDNLTFWTKIPGGPGNAVTEKVRITSTGNVGIGTTNPTNPLQMASGPFVTAGGVWTNASDRNLKENFTAVSAAAILEKIRALPLTDWNYKNEDPSVRHIGPVAQDFYAIFGVGNSSTSISTIDPAGVALAGIQGLDERSQGRAGKLAALKKLLDAETEEIWSLRKRLVRLESLLEQTTSEKGIR